MPRNGSGVASAVPGFNSVAASTTILSALHNSGINDLISMFNTAWPTSLGGTGGTSVITSWDALTAEGSVVPSASTLVLTTATGPRIDISGTTAVTAVTLANGTMRIARATGAFVLTAGASLKVNGSTTQNYTTTSGDLLFFQAEAGVVSVYVVRAISPTAAPTPQGYGFGCTLSNGTDATNDIDVSAGTWRDSTNVDDMVVGQITKELDVAWQVGGTAAVPLGGLDQGSIANATYHMHLIKRVDTNVVDAIYSLSHDKPATITMTLASPAVVTWGVAGKGHGLVAGSPFKFSTTGALPTGVTAGTQYYVISTGLAETTFQFSASNGGAAINSSVSQSGVHTGIPGPQMPTSYTLFRRIGSIVRTGAAIKAFTQNGDEFRWSTVVGDVAANAPGITAVTRTLTVPVGIIIDALLRFNLVNASAATAAQLLLSAMTDTDVAANATAGNTQGIAFGAAAGTANAPGDLAIKTNAGAQIRSRIASLGDANVTLNIVTYGWRDTRGRLA